MKNKWTIIVWKKCNQCQGWAWWLFLGVQIASFIYLIAYMQTIHNSSLLGLSLFCCWQYLDRYWIYLLWENFLLVLILVLLLMEAKLLFFTYTMKITLQHRGLNKKLKMNHQQLLKLNNSFLFGKLYIEQDSFYFLHSHLCSTYVLCY